MRTLLLTIFLSAAAVGAAAPATPAATAAAATPAATAAAAPAASAAHPANPHADAGGIDWFPGDVAGAFAAAAAAHKPVFLYWGAKWCPPCQQLKSSVFSRSDFIEKSKQFVAVYLDGDDPGAQKWGARFHVSGYPTVLILRPDAKEIMRLMGGTDLAQYAEVLDVALNGLSPITEILATLHPGGAALTHAECQRLAYNGWVYVDYAQPRAQAVALQLERAAAACASLITRAEHAQLVIAAAALAARPGPVARVVEIVEDPQVAPQVAVSLEGLAWTSPVVDALHGLDAQARARFLAAWAHTMDEVADDPKVIDAEQLAAVSAKLAMTKKLSADHAIPAEFVAQARRRMALALAKPASPYVRAGVVNSASNIDDELDDTDAEYALLKGELATAKTPYYYMLDLGDLEEKRGHADAALGWYQRAFDESQGIATRFAWGTEYLTALLRLTPADHARIRTVGLEVIAELDGPDRVQARSRARLEKLDAKLRQWNAGHRYDADIAALRTRMGEVCVKIPSGDAGRGSCRKFLS